MIDTLTDCHGISDVIGQRGSNSRGSTNSHTVKGSVRLELQRINILTSCQGMIDQRCIRSARLELHRGSTHSQSVKESATCSVSDRGTAHSPTVKGSATCSVSEAPGSLTRCQGISDVFGQRGSISTEYQYTHHLSRDQRHVRSPRLELHKGSTLTSCQGVRHVFGQRGSSSTEDL
jgi:hypothetical protein